MVIPVAAPAVGSILKVAGGLFGLFKKKPKQITPADNLMSQAKGAREAAAAHGFNALTMLQYGQTGASTGSIDSGAPALASLSLLGDIINEEFGPDARDRREHNQLNNDLLRLQVEQARGNVPAPASAVAGLTDRAPALGGRPSTSATMTGVQPGPFQMGVLGEGRGIKESPTEDMSGFMRIRNGLTDKDGFLVPGSDGEPLDIWQLPVVGASWAADKAWDFGSRAGEWLAKSPSSPIQKEKFRHPAEDFTEDGRPFWRTGSGVSFINPATGKKGF